MECSGSVDRLQITAGEVTVLCPRARHFIRCLVLVQPRKTGNKLSQHDWKNVDWDIKHQNNQNVPSLSFIILVSYLKVPLFIVQYLSLASAK